MSMSLNEKTRLHRRHVHCNCIEPDNVGSDEERDVFVEQTVAFCISSISVSFDSASLSLMRKCMFFGTSAKMIDDLVCGTRKATCRKSKLRLCEARREHFVVYAC